MGLANYEQQQVNLKQMKLAVQELKRCESMLAQDREQIRACWAVNADSAVQTSALDWLREYVRTQVTGRASWFIGTAYGVLETMNDLNKLIAFASEPFYGQQPRTMRSPERQHIRVNTDELRKAKESLSRSFRILSEFQQKMRSGGNNIDQMILQQRDLHLKLNMLHNAIGNACQINKAMMHAIEDAIHIYERAEKRIICRAEGITTPKAPALRATFTHPPYGFDTPSGLYPGSEFTTILKSSFQDNPD